ncbi:hypothetical protein TNCV_1789161 [Trichonephila clavipes]|nr:hypothetical protein TNCV_1789161 [Trichonephila clavipes]
MRPAHSAAIQEWMVTTCSNALDSMNTRLTTLSVGTGRLGVTNVQEAKKGRRVNKNELCNVKGVHDARL